jgi:hypothetical protein
MTPGIPKFRRESHPERTRIKSPPIFSQLLSGYILPFPEEFDNLAKIRTFDGRRIWK